MRLMDRKKILNLAGFSLVEMMLVIVVISIIAMYAANIARQRAQTALAATTAGEMQLWLQASINYYTQSNQWPQATGPNDTGFQALNSKNLLPNSAQCSQILIQNSGNENCGAYSPFYLSYAPNSNYQNSLYISVNLQVPTEALGAAIAAKLPAGNYTNNIVTTSAVLPGGLSIKPYFASVITQNGLTATCYAQHPAPYPTQGCFLLQANLVDFKNQNESTTNGKNCYYESQINSNTNKANGSCTNSSNTTAANLQSNYPY